jgi:DNA polymerase-4
MTERDAQRMPFWSGRAILHMDMDAFFASVEQLDHPEWRGRPVIVGGDPSGRGVVSTASYEARAYGIHSAMPAAQAARLCPDAVWARPRFKRYSELSRAVRGILEAFTPHIEPTSIDEAYLDVSPGQTGRHPVEIAEQIRRDVDALGLSCSLGVATGKTLAKIASDRDKPHGITVVWPGTEAAFLAPLSVNVLPGIGAQTAQRLLGAGIRTLGDLARLDLGTAETLAGSWGRELLDRARGIDERPVAASNNVKSVSNERTFAHDLHERADAERALGALVEKVASRLRAGLLVARTFTVKLRFADFTTRTVRRTLEVPTDLEDEMLPVALSLLGRAWSPGAGLRLLGFGASGFDEPAQQLGLLDRVETDAPEIRQQRRALAAEIDAIRERFGADALRRGSDLER